MPAASILIKPSSTNCNIDCNYCFYKCLSSNRAEYSKGFMSEEILEKLVIQAFDYAEGFVSFAFQGGEPTLSGLAFFRKVIELQKKYNTKSLRVENTIQTNGILIDKEWAQFLAKYDFLVGLSLDGPKSIHDRYRKNLQGEGTFEQVMNAVSLFNKYNVAYNIVSVITEEAAQKAAYLYKFCKRNQFSYMQFIPCMDERIRQVSGLPDKMQRCGLSVDEYKNKFAVTPEAYGSFLCEMFDLWYEDFCHGEQRDIRMFSNLAQMAAGYPAEECGMNGCCNCYFVVEGDGSVYPCDFYCQDKWKLGTVEESFGLMKQSLKAEVFVTSSQKTAEECELCQYLQLCKGGCRRWREVAGNGQIGLNYLCQSYKIFFAHTSKRIEELGSYIKKRYKI